MMAPYWALKIYTRHFYKNLKTSFSPIILHFLDFIPDGFWFLTFVLALE